MNIDAKRLRTVFKDPALEPLLVRMRKRLESGRKLAGTLVLTGLGAQQREAVGSLLGRPPAQLGADNVSVPLDELEAMLPQPLSASRTSIFVASAAYFADSPRSNERGPVEAARHNRSGTPAPRPLRARMSAAPLKRDGAGSGEGDDRFLRARMSAAP